MGESRVAVEGVAEGEADAQHGAALQRNQQGEP